MFLVSGIIRRVEAIKQLYGTQLGGRSIVVNESRPQEKKNFDRAGSGGGDREGGFGKQRESRWSEQLSSNHSFRPYGDSVSVGPFHFFTLRVKLCF